MPNTTDRLKRLKWSKAVVLPQNETEDYRQWTAEQNGILFYIQERYVYLKDTFEYRYGIQAKGGRQHGNWHKSLNVFCWPTRHKAISEINKWRKERYELYLCLKDEYEG